MHERNADSEANAGGENVARGSALGALLGAQYGVRGFPNDLRALYNQKEIEAEITASVFFLFLMQGEWVDIFLTKLNEISEKSGKFSESVL